jgi:hypothetical protein
MGNIRKGRDVNGALCKKGVQREVNGDHVCYEYPNSDVRTKISHGILGQDIDRELLGKMAQHVHLEFGQFMDLVDCPLGKADYTTILSKLGLIHSVRERTATTPSRKKEHKKNNKRS